MFQTNMKIFFPHYFGCIPAGIANKISKKSKEKTSLNLSDANRDILLRLRFIKLCSYLLIDVKYCSKKSLACSKMISFFLDSIPTVQKLTTLPMQTSFEHGKFV